MPPLPLPHRVSFVHPGLTLAAPEEALGLLAAKLLLATSFDYLVWHPIVALGDVDDERITDADGTAIDTRHPDFEDTLDRYFTVARRDEVLWWELSLDAARPATVQLSCARADGGRDDFRAGPNDTLSDQMTHCLYQWLTARHLPALPDALRRFSAADVVDVLHRLERVRVARAGGPVGDALLAAPPRLAISFYRVLHDLGAVEGHRLDALILAAEPHHPVARRNAYIRGLYNHKVERRAILTLIGEVPMFGKPHLSVWGKDFKDDRRVEKMGVRHQGIAAMLLPDNPWANHNYALQLEDVNRKEESYRWADRATIAAPGFYQAHLQAVRIRRQTLRLGETFTEASRRCNLILERWNAGRINRSDWSHKVHAGMQLAMVHHDCGRLADAIRIASEAIADVEAQAAGHDDYAWAVEKIAEWKTDPIVLANSYAYDGHFRNAPGRVITGFGKGDIAYAEDVAMYCDALIALGREDHALLAFAHHEGWDIIGGGKARLAGARAHILCGDLDQALDHIQICQLRLSQSRLEAEINRLFRLAVVRPIADWEAVVQRRLDRGARRLAKNAARDLADFVPGLAASAVIRQALTGGGPYRSFAFDDTWLEPLRAAAAPAAIDPIDRRLRGATEATLRAADELAQGWWSALAPPAKKVERAHGALYAFVHAFARYCALASGPPNPLAGGYRHIATEALQVMHQGRFAIEDTAIHAALDVFERLAGQEPGIDVWQLDWWLLRFERALELDTSYGALMSALTEGLPRVRAMLRGDERIGFELRMAFDLKEDPSCLEPARLLFERCQRAMETGAAAVQWSETADATLSAADALDVHWTCTLANPGNHAGPWVQAARASFARGRGDDAMYALGWAFRPTSEEWRKAQLARLEPSWRAAGFDLPFELAAARGVGLEAMRDGELELALQCFQWCDAIDPKNPGLKHDLGVTYAMLGRVYDAIRELSAAEGDDGPRKAGHTFMQHQRYPDAVRAYHYACLRSDDAEDWRLLANAAWFAADDEMAALAYGHLVDASPVQSDHQTLHCYAVVLNAIGQYARAEAVAAELLAQAADDSTFRAAALHSRARALLGLGRAAEALPLAEEAVRTNPLTENTTELAETLARIQRQEPWPVKPSKEASPERRAFAALARGDVAAVEQLARETSSWALQRAALAAAELRDAIDHDTAVSTRALVAADTVVHRTLGATGADAVLCRLRALRIRENAQIKIDPPPPLATPLSEAELAAGLAARRDHDAAPEPAAEDQRGGDGAGRAGTVMGAESKMIRARLSTGPI